MQVNSDNQICRGTGSSSIARCWRSGPQNGLHGHFDGHEDRMGLAELDDPRRHESMLVGQHLLLHLGQPAHPEEDQHVDRHQRVGDHRGPLGRVVVVQGEHSINLA